MPDFEADKLKGFQFSEDGKFVRIFLTTSTEGGDIFLTMPADQIEDFWNHLGRVVKAIQVANGGKRAAAPPRVPAHWKVGASNAAQFARFTAIMFDADTVDEALFLMTDLDALKMADAIEQKVFQGMSLDDQRKMIKVVEEARPGGGKARVILPPGVRRN